MGGFGAFVAAEGAISIGVDSGLTAIVAGLIAVLVACLTLEDAFGCKAIALNGIDVVAIMATRTAMARCFKGFTATTDRTESQRRLTSS